MAKRNGHSARSIHRALEILDEAAQEKKEELYEVLGEQYEDLRKAMEGIASQAVSAVGEGRERIRETVGRAGEQFKQLDQSVHDHPWYFAAAVAVGAFWLGFLSSKK